MTTYVFFFYYEYVCFKQQNETNQFELISQTDVNQIMQHMINKQYENLNDLDTSQEYEETKRGFGLLDIQHDIEKELEGESDESSRLEEASRGHERDTDYGHHRKHHVKTLQPADVASARSFSTHDRRSLDNSSQQPRRSQTTKDRKKKTKDGEKQSKKGGTLADTAVDYSRYKEILRKKREQQ